MAGTVHEMENPAAADAHSTTRPWTLRTSDSKPSNCPRCC